MHSDGSIRWTRNRARAWGRMPKERAAFVMSYGFADEKGGTEDASFSIPPLAGQIHFLEGHSSNATYLEDALLHLSEASQRAHLRVPV